MGEGPLLPQAKALAEALGLGERVRFLGKRLDVDRVLAEAQVFVLATNWEGLPFPYSRPCGPGFPWWPRAWAGWERRWWRERRGSW